MVSTEGKLFLARRAAWILAVFLDNHIFDKVTSIRLDLASHWHLKAEGHFMNGYAASDAFRSFYPQDNPQGFKPGTNLLVIRTGFQF